jgi:hypothetical protein
MSRTYRKKPNCFRKPTTLGTQKKEQYANEEIKETRFSSNRLSARANISSGKLPSSYDDLSYNTRERTNSEIKSRLRNKKYHVNTYKH